MLNDDPDCLPPATAAADPAERLNQGCFCITLDRQALSRELDVEVGIPGFASALAGSHPSLFSNVPVFVTRATMAALEGVVAAVETAAGLPAYNAAAMARAPAIALADFGPVGALMGYDFHITADGPRLIEINTNAGGAFLNNALAAAQRACCREGQSLIGNIVPPRDFAAQITDMFTAEWRLQRGAGQPSTIAIVDDDPDGQFLLPEFQLARAILQASGIRTVIADPAALSFDGSTLWFDGHAIDLVYNRLVDFGLAEDRHAALRAAYESSKVIVSPNPHNHALLADKRNLMLLSDTETLELWGLGAQHRKALDGAVPLTMIVNAANADALWADRRNQFFKPASGHGSKAAYRGEKLTRKVWAEILGGSYVAQAYAPPSSRMIVHNGAPSAFKLDIRLYTYAGATLLAAARLYQGQTTNMRTPGGGFAPVFEITGNGPVPPTAADRHHAY
ncbi:MAG: hypothetical protein H7267_00530 [Sandarakinorhabdus sp.]|nr:hypothetical protein [Sandarakinorhabdus sp.]